MLRKSETQIEIEKEKRLAREKSQQQLARDFSFFNKSGHHVIERQENAGNGHTNQNKRVKTTSQHQFVARRPGRGTNQIINRKHEAYNNQIAIKAGVAPSVPWDKENGFRVTEWIENATPMTHRMLTTAPKSSEHLMGVVDVLKKLHNWGGEPFANDVDIFDEIRKIKRLLKENGCPVAETSASSKLLEIEDILKTFSVTKVPCHNDTTAGNFILGNNNKMFIIDLEYSGNNNRIFDLSNLARDCEFTRHNEDFMLRAYFGDELNDDIIRQFLLFQPVAEYYWGLWCQLQVANANEQSSNLYQMRDYGNKRMKNCYDLLDSERIKAAIEGKVYQDKPVVVDDGVEKSRSLFSCCRR